jgi:hypothetical protein
VPDRGWRQANPVKAREGYRRQAGKWAKANPEAQQAIYKRYQRKKRGQIEAPTRPMPELCECCIKSGKMVEDHNHITGKFRGWLCFMCNTSIGKLGDTPEGVTKALVYLEKYHAE